MPRVNANKDCPVCRGKGFTRSKDATTGKYVKHECRRCKGTGVEKLTQPYRI